MLADLLQVRSEVNDEPYCWFLQVVLVPVLVLLEPIPVVVGPEIAEEGERRVCEVLTRHTVSRVGRVRTPPPDGTVASANTQVGRLEAARKAAASPKPPGPISCLSD